MSADRKQYSTLPVGKRMALFLSFLRLAETVLFILIKLVFVFLVGFVMLIGAIVWKK